VLAAAVTSAAADERLGEVVVTAPSLAERRAAEDPTAFATVIETGAAPTEVKTLTDVLADAVGVQVRRYGGLGDFSTVSIRGSSAGQVQLYLDGVPLSRAENEVVNLADLPEALGTNCFAGSGKRWKTRMFGLGGIAEDPATGSAAGPLAVHLARHGKIAWGDEIEISQGAEIGRPSTLYARADGSAEQIERVEVGGSAVVVARGEFRLP